MSKTHRTDRRQFIQLGGAALGAATLPRWAVAQSSPAIVASDATRPAALQGVQFGDPSRGSVLAWSRSDRPARMIVEWSLDARFLQPTRLVGPYALEGTDFTARQDISGLPENREVFVRVMFQSLTSARAVRARHWPLPHAAGPARGRRRLAPRRARPALHLGRRHRRTGLGHQHGLRRHEDL